MMFGVEVVENKEDMKNKEYNETYEANSVGWVLRLTKMVGLFTLEKAESARTMRLVCQSAVAVKEQGDLGLIGLVKTATALIPKEARALLCPRSSRTTPPSSQTTTRTSMQGASSTMSV